MLGKAGNNVEAVFKRVERWMLEIPEIIEPQFVKIHNAVIIHPFGDLSIWMSVECAKIKEIAEKLPHAKQANIKRFDGCGIQQEEWDVELHKVYNILEYMDENDIYGSLEFKIKWTEKKEQ